MDLQLRAFFKFSNNYVDFISIDFRSKQILFPASIGWTNLDEVILELFTGQTGINGEKIFEGDIIKAPDSDVLGVVKYVNSSFIVEWKADVYSDLLGWSDFKRGKKQKEYYRVMGNINKNKELLK